MAALQLQSMIKERAALEKKVAKLYAAFGKKWDSKIVKLPTFAHGEMAAVVYAACKQAVDTAAGHEALAATLQGGRKRCMQTTLSTLSH